MSGLALLSENYVRNPTIEAVPVTAEKLHLPVWTRNIEDRLVSFLSLEKGWDAYDAPPPDFDAVVAAFDLLMMISEDSTPAPQVVPTPNGGVQLEWHERGIDLEIEVRSEFQFDVFYENLRTGEVREEEIMADLTPLRNWVGLLSQ